MSIGRTILMRMFGRPSGLLGRLGGHIMASTNRRYAAWAATLLDAPTDATVLDVGCGPGVALEALAEGTRQVTGVDMSTEMLRQAARRNAAAIRTGGVRLVLSSAEALPFADGAFDAAMSINSMQVWPAPIAGLREIRRTLRPASRLVLVFTTYSGQAREGVPELVAAAGYIDCRFFEGDKAFCILASTPAAA